jgi:hypothetical protein
MSQDSGVVPGPASPRKVKGSKVSLKNIPDVGVLQIVLQKIQLTGSDSRVVNAFVNIRAAHGNVFEGVKQRSKEVKGNVSSEIVIDETFEFGVKENTNQAFHFRVWVLNFI